MMFSQEWCYNTPYHLLLLLLPLAVGITYLITSFLVEQKMFNEEIQREKL